MQNFLPPISLGQLFTTDYITIGVVTFILLALTGAAIHIGMRARAQKAAQRRQRRRRSRASSSSSSTRNKDFFQLDMSRYEEPQSADASANANLTALPTSEANSLAWKSAAQHPLAVADAPSKPESETALATPRSKLNVVHRKLSLPSGMQRIMDVLKKNRRYEFTELDGRQNRLGAPCTGGLFAEIHFGRSEDDSVLHGLLNPD